MDDSPILVCAFADAPLAVEGAVGGGDRTGGADSETESPEEPQLTEPKDVKDEDWVMPTHCLCCGAFLMGSLTKHKEDCQILAIIRSHFPNWPPPA